MKTLLKNTAHKAGIIAGKRSPSPKGSIPYTSELVGQLSPDVFQYHEVIAAQTIEPTAHESTAPILRNHGNDPAIREYPAAFYAQMKGGHIVAHGVLTPDKRVIGDLSIEGGIRPEKVANHSLLSRPSIAPYQHLSGRSACLINTYAGNYYHWLLEVIPRYQLLRRHAAKELEACERVIFNEATHSYHREVIEYLGLKDKAFESNNNSFTLDEMLVPALSGIMINPPPWACRYAREALIGMGENARDMKVAPYIYISRDKAPRRRVLNEAAILEVLLPLGFEVVRPEEWTVAQQVRAFSQAKVVISPHGAALSNLLFCSPGTGVVEMFSPDSIPPCYWLTASHGQLEYRAIVGEPIHTGQDEHPDMEVNIEKLKAVLKTLGLL